MLSATTCVSLIMLALNAAPPLPPGFRQPPPQPQNELLFYQCQGFRIWSYSYMEVQILSDGSANFDMVRGFHDIGQEHITGSIRLLPEALAKVERLVDDLPLLDIPSDPRPMYTDTGERFIRINRNGNTHELQYSWRDKLVDLSRFVEEIGRQFSALYAARNHIPCEDPDGRDTILIDREEFRKALQKAFLLDSEPRYMHERMEALAAVTSPDEWTSLFLSLLEKLDPAKREAYTFFACQYFNLPGEHAKRLPATVVKLILAEEKNWEQMTDADRYTWTRFLGMAMAGRPACVTDLLPLLTSPVRGLRLEACGQIQSALTRHIHVINVMNKDNPPGWKLPEFSITEAENKLLPVLRKMAAEDDDPIAKGEAEKLLATFATLKRLKIGDGASDGDDPHDGCGGDVYQRDSRSRSAEPAVLAD